VGKTKTTNSYIFDYLIEYVSRALCSHLAPAALFVFIFLHMLMFLKAPRE